MRSRLDSRLSLGRSPLEVDFIGRSSGERCVRAMLIVPVDECEYLSTELVATQRDEDSSSAFILDGPDHSLNNSNATMLANGLVARWLDPLAFYPSPKGMTVENSVPVADDVFWLCASSTNCPS